MLACVSLCADRSQQSGRRTGSPSNSDGSCCQPLPANRISSPVNLPTAVNPSDRTVRELTISALNVAAATTAGASVKKTVIDGHLFRAGIISKSSSNVVVVKDASSSICVRRQAKPSKEREEAVQAKDHLS